jgi:Ca-activated chloride channel family protein
VDPTPPPVQVDAQGPLAVTAKLARQWLDPRGGAQYLEIDLTAAGVAGQGGKGAVNAVLVIDRSGSMSGPKIEKAREAARQLISSLDGEDRLSIVDFASDAHLLFASTAMSAVAKERALGLVAGIMATTGTNISAALELAAPQLRAGRGGGRTDKVFLASDGQANEGVYERTALERLSARQLEGATVSTFGIGDDYDEDLMTALALQAGGRARFIEQAGELPEAIRAELARAAAVVARGVKLEVQGSAGAQVERVLGLRAEKDGTLRLPDFSAGETRRVLVKLRLPQNTTGQGAARFAHVSVRCEDAAGKQYQAQAEASASYTADARLLSAPAGEAEEWGAKAEMADVAQRAVRAQESGDRAEAARQVAELHRVAKEAAMARPAAAPMVMKAAGGWSGLLGASERGAPADKKRAKQSAYDTLNAPAAGW